MDTDCVIDVKGITLDGNVSVPSLRLSIGDFVDLPLPVALHTRLDAVARSIFAKTSAATFAFATDRNVLRNCWLLELVRKRTVSDYLRRECEISKTRAQSLMHRIGVNDYRIGQLGGCQRYVLAIVAAIETAEFIIIDSFRFNNTTNCRAAAPLIEDARAVKAFLNLVPEPHWEH